MAKITETSIIMKEEEVMVETSISEQEQILTSIV